MKGPSLLIAMMLALPVPAFALQSMDDEAMSDFVAQDGATWSMDVSQEIGSMRIVDKNGFTGATSPGQVIINNTGIKTCSETAALGACTLTTSGAGMSVVFDAGAQSTGTAPVLMAGITLARKIRQQMDSLEVGDVNLLSPHKLPTTKFKIMEINPGALLADKYMDIITAAGSKLRFDLGHQPGGHLLTAQSLQIESITINNSSGTAMAVCDASSPGCANAFSVGSFAITGNGVGNNIDLSGSGMGVNANGLYLTLGPNVKMDIVQGNVGLGAASNPKIGSMALRGLDLSGATVTLRGH